MIQEYKEFWKQYRPHKLHRTDEEAIAKFTPKQREKLLTYLSPQALQEKYIDLDDETKNKEFRDDLRNQSAIHSNMYCKPFTGNPETAKVFFLYGNPGLDLRDYKNEHFNDEYRSALDDELNFKSTGFLYLNETLEVTNSFAYWNRKGSLTTLIYELSRSKPCSIQEAKAILSNSMCLLQSVGYHSRNTPYKKLEGLPSSLMQKRLLHEYLLPRAEKKEIFIFRWRAPKFWGLNGLENESNIMVRDSSMGINSSFMKGEVQRIINFLLDH